jgi:hypothetical protein
VLPAVCNAELVGDVWRLRHRVIIAAEQAVSISLRDPKLTPPRLAGGTLPSILGVASGEKPR